MEKIFYPDEKSVRCAMERDEPLPVLISRDGEQIIVSRTDDAAEHHVLLRQVGIPDTDIDKYFRPVLNKDGADWTFVCPDGVGSDRCYSDGMTVIPKALAELGYGGVPIEIPKRYRRHFDMMGE